MVKVSIQEVSSYSDAMLLSAVVDSDVVAFETLYDRHAPKVYSMMVRIVRDKSLAEELTTETFWQVWKKAEQYNQSGHAVAWIYRIARNKAIDQLRKSKNLPLVFEANPEIVDFVTQTHVSGVEQIAETNWANESLRQAFDQIPQEQQVCLHLAFFDGLTHNEIAEKIDIPVGTIKTRIRIGMQKLQRILIGYGFTGNAEALSH